MDDTTPITNTRNILQISADPPVGAAMTETLATDTTEVRLLPTVDPQVLSQRCPAWRKTLSVKLLVGLMEIKGKCGESLGTDRHTSP